jgi:hypothetical protein
VNTLPEIIEIWRTEWLRWLERYPSPSSEDSQLEQGDQSVCKIYLGCMRTFGSVEEVLTMIEEGEQGRSLGARVNAIREDLNRMRALKNLWDDEGLNGLMDQYLDHMVVGDNEPRLSEIMGGGLDDELDKDED